MSTASAFIESSLKNLDLWDENGANTIQVDPTSTRAEKLLFCETGSQCPGIENLSVDHVFIGRRSYKLPSGMISPGTVIGRFCSISHFVNIGATGHHMDWLSTGMLPNGLYGEDRGTVDQGLTVIQNDVWIGVNATILGGKNIVVGHGACVGAGSVVTKSVPPYAVVAGNPARIIRYRFPEDIVERLLKSQWWRLDDETIARLPYRDVELTLDVLEEMALDAEG